MTQEALNEIRRDIERVSPEVVAKASGFAASILADPQHPYTRGLIASVPTLRGDVPPAPIRGEPGSVPPGRRGCLDRPR